MQIGTAGLTAMFCVMALEERGVQPDKGEIIVTGANRRRGLRCRDVVGETWLPGRGSTGKADAHEFLSPSALTKSSIAVSWLRGVTNRWSGSSGRRRGFGWRETLVALLRQMRREGCVTAVGLAGGAELHATVYPFILRAVSLIGFLVYMVAEHRRAWTRLACELPMETPRSPEPDSATGRSPALGERMIDGKLARRVVIDVNA